MHKNDRQIVLLLIVIVVSIAAPFFLHGLQSMSRADLQWWIDISEIVRNGVLAAAAIIGLPYLIIRTVAATRQAEASNQQAVTANKQAEIAERGQHIDRHQKGAEMLQSKHPFVRNAGIQTLRDLALIDPDSSYKNVLELLFHFVKEKTRYRMEKHSVTQLRLPIGAPPEPAMASDVQAAFSAITHLRNSIKNSSEYEDGWMPDLSGVQLSGASLANENLSGVSLNQADLSNGVLPKANLSGASLHEVKLRNARLTFGTNLAGANLFRADLQCALFTEADLSNASLTSANLCSTGFRFANLTNADLSFATLIETNFSGAILTNVRLRNATIQRITAHEDTPPIDMPEEMANAIYYLRSGESFEQFRLRMAREHPAAGW